MSFLRKLLSMLRKDVLDVSESLVTDSDTFSSLSELRTTSDQLLSDLLPVFEDSRNSDNDENK